MRYFFAGFVSIIVAGGGILAMLFLFPSTLLESPAMVYGKISSFTARQSREQNLSKTKEERIAAALQRSSNIKGLYMTADVANDPGRGATNLRQHIIKLARTTEINGLVIDVKEVCGPDYREARLRQLLEELHRDNIWAIARITVFKDASQINAHPEWYLKTSRPRSLPDGCMRKSALRAKPLVAASIESLPAKTAGAPLWKDNKGGYWLDPASPGARAYTASFAKKMIDLGFDELQFDYVRFPSDGDVANAIYPSWNKKIAKPEVMKSFFQLLNRELKAYKSEIILSADLFGYVALLNNDVGIGQRLEDIGNNFDYVSFMVYPSHYYNGLVLGPDARRNLPALNLNVAQARAHPDVVIERSLNVARDFLDSVASTTELRLATSSLATASNVRSGGDARSRVRLRPWLEDFFHEEDRLAKRPYGSQKVRMQIDAAQRVEQHGWLLWNASNVYAEGALRPKGAPETR
ncbi:MAG: hypothetical protein HY006_00820 [Candidatus Sungbacteria bacterium]|nr:hypothetical protein [Candidatus Sungbacteria bacterium]